MQFYGVVNNLNYPVIMSVIIIARTLPNLVLNKFNAHDRLAVILH
jgi:hypothetical protein